jgi:hypothetical protein
MMSLGRRRAPHLVTEAFQPVSARLEQFFEEHFAVWQGAGQGYSGPKPLLAGF